MQNNVRTDVPFSPSLLKSAIQKAVRRGEVDKALACTKSLLDKDPRACLRRLMVIVMEDGLLLPNYDKLAVLTDRIRVKGSDLTEEDKTLVLSMVADLTCSETRDFEKNNPDYSKDYKVAKLKDEELALINAINYRVRIGGWKDDLDMLRVFAKVWNKRFTEGTWDVKKLRSYFTGEVIEYADVPYASKEDVPIEAIDFHCSPVGRILLKKPYVSKLIQEAMPINTRAWAGEWQSDEDILNKIVWCLRSGVSFKKVLWTDKPVDWLIEDKIPQEHWDDFKSIYQKIEPELNSIAHWYLDKVS
ncbi:MAG TPA: hypothetical protein VGF75_00615 [Candidatus Saccharimonadales bacterium]|jgi:hypothetical protein